MRLSRIHHKYLFLLVAFAMSLGSAKADLLVTDASNHSVLRYSNAGILVGTFIPPGSGGPLTGPPVFGPDGNLYLLDQQNIGVLRYNGSTGAFMDMFVTAGSSGLSVPTALTFGPDGNLYISDNGPTQAARVVRRYNGTTGAYLG